MSDPHPDYANNPECRDGKHTNCSGEGWDMTADLPCPCRCMCHVGPDPEATCVTCGHFFNPESGELTCSDQCEILRVHDEAALIEPAPSHQLGGGF